MATLVTPTNLQKVEYDVTTAEVAARVTVVTGTLPFVFEAISQGSTSTQSISLKAHVDPALTPGRFRRSTATASLAGTFQFAQTPSNAQWTIDDAQATFDDESGQVQLVVDVTVLASGANTQVGFTSIMFQVTTLAII